MPTDVRSVLCLSSRVSRNMRIFFILLALFITGVTYAVTPAGTLIRNQASASYTDSEGRRVTVQSNIVETLVEQVAGLELTNDQQLRGDAGSSVLISHRIVNTGNGDDSYSLQLQNTGGNINLSNLRIFADANGDGLPDSSVPITTTPLIAADQDYFIVLSGDIPASANDGDSAAITVTASSTFNASINAQNNDLVISGVGASIQVTKSMSSTQGRSPSSPYTVTLRYENTGSQSAGNVTLIDALPAGMTYVPGSGRWSESSVVLSDADPLDTHPGQSGNIRYCAYDASCTGLSEANNDADASSDNQVTAIIDFVPPGGIATLSFEVSIDGGLASGFLINEAEFEYDVAINTVPREFTNTVAFEVLPVSGVVANGSNTSPINGLSEPVSIFSAAQGGKIRFDNYIWNTGNTADTFNIEVDSLGSTFPPGTLWRLLRSDGATLMQDTNGDGAIDTGPVAPDSFSLVVLELELPGDASGNNSGIGFDVTKTARSVIDSTVFDTVTDHLDEIVANQVDITNQAPAGAADALGAGPGPESSPVSVVSPDGNRQALFDLYIRHQGIEPDNYGLTAYATAGGNPLPPGWQVRFLDPGSSQPRSVTRLLASGESQHVIAEVTVPEDLALGTTSVFFGATSLSGGASDIKHDGVSINVVNALRIEPSLTATITPGSTTVYQHRLINEGNVDLTDIQLTTSESRPGWLSAIFADTDGNGVLSSADQVLTAPWSLAAGENSSFFVRVSAPADAVNLQRNSTIIQAQWNGNSESVQIVDQTTVSTSNVTILKEQAVDVGCDGAPDAGSNFTTSEISVEPGNNCVIYRLTALNRGQEPSFNVKIHDSTPSFTVYRTPATCSRTPCWIIEPGEEGAGVINAETDQLLPGDSFFLEFSVRLVN